MCHKCRRVAANTGELGFMAWYVRFYIDLTVKKGNIS